MILKNNKELMQKDFANEKELQTFFEKNLQQILNLEFVDSEFSVGNFRIDTLGFDKETKSFRIIEYKNVKNHSLVDQGYTYLKLLLERKADFVLQYSDILDLEFDRNNQASSVDELKFYENIDFTLKELGAALDIPISRSGANHRMQRIAEIAENIRKEKAKRS